MNRDRVYGGMVHRGMCCAAFFVCNYGEIYFISGGLSFLSDCEIKEFDSGEEFLLDGEKFDILFLDIQMDGINGIQAAAKVGEKDEDYIIIFITGVKEYVFDMTAFHYLLKPIKSE